VRVVSVPRPIRTRFYFWLAMLALGIASCGESQDGSSNAPTWQVDSRTLRPAGGKVTLNGKPVTKAIVSFFPKSMVPSVGETNGEGRYVLKTMNSEGVPPGDYKVTVSYYVSPSGRPQGLAERSAMVQSDEMRLAHEALPAQFTDAQQTKLTATVGPDGGASFDFNLEASLPEAPTSSASPSEAPDQAARPKSAAEKQPQPSESTDIEKKQ
jgi:hypothetical protein